MANWAANTYTISVGTTGTSTGSNTSTSFNNTGATWPTSPNLANYTLRILSGTGSGQERIIASNTATSATVSAWTTIPDATSTYEIVLKYYTADHITGSNTLGNGIITEIEDSATLHIDGNYIIAFQGSCIVRWNKSTTTIPTIQQNNIATVGVSGFWSYFQFVSTLTGTVAFSYLKILGATRTALIAQHTGVGDYTGIHHIWGEGMSTYGIHIDDTTGTAATGTLANMFFRQALRTDIVYRGNGGFNVTTTYNKIWAERAWTAIFHNQLDGNQIASRCVMKPFVAPTGTYPVPTSRTWRIEDSYLDSSGYTAKMFGSGVAHVGTAQAFRNVCNGGTLVSDNGTTGAGTLSSAFNDAVNNGKKDGTLKWIQTSGSAFSTARTCDNDLIAGYFNAMDTNIDTATATTSGSTPSQYGGLSATRTNVKTVRNRPLTCDNVVAGTPTDSTVTITFDCTNGAVSGQGSTTINVDSPSGAATLNVASSTGFQVGETIEVGYGTARFEELVVSATGAGTITTTTNLAFTHTSAQADTVKKQLRNLSIPFLRYGTTSGVYNKSTPLPNMLDWGLFYTGIRTTQDGATYAFNYKGHSITLSNLEPSKTYFFKACAYTPLGDLQESTESSFTTAASLYYSDPDIANVRLSTAYQFNSLSNNRTGNVRVPGVGNVKTGFIYDTLDTLTGTYDGSDRWTDPGDNNVRFSTAYKANSTTNNKTGRVVVPVAADVKTGVTFETDSGTTGTYDGSDRWTDPGDNNVRFSTTYKANSTSLNKTGRVVVPIASNVKTGITFETDSGTTGTYDGSDRWTDPLIGNVRLGITYKANSTSNNRTGNVVLPATTDVKNTVQYGALGTEYTGSFGDGTAPTFSGITSAVAQTDGSLLASWSAASDPSTPIRYNVYIQAATATGLFSTTPITTTATSLKVYAIPGGATLVNGQLYYMGVRAFDNNGNTDTNTASASATSVGVSSGSALPVHVAHGVFSINASNELQGTFWGTLDGSLVTSSLGTASYTIYDEDGVAVSGLSESGIAADGNGQFQITPVAATLLQDLTHYVAKITVVMSAVSYINYKAFSIGE